ncbi:MAG: alpha/beta hydrolase family protein [Saprospiraceae bacterium]
MRILYTFILFSILINTAFAQSDKSEIEQLRADIRNLRHNFQALEKGIDDLLWYEKVRDVAYMDKVELTSAPIGKDKKITLGSYDPVYKTNPMRFKTYVFIPKDIDENKKYPLLVLPHGGVHSNFKSSLYAHIIRELVAQGYVVTAPEYRGSTGYGKRFYEQIDYGGLEVQDANAARDYVIENYGFVDGDRTGILGWSHGGLITLMNLFEFPNDYKVGYAGVPVSDLIVRMGNKTQRYRELYEVDYHIGKSANEDIEEYKRRSPAWQAEKLQTPLLIHTNTIDPDVTVSEVQYLITALKAAKKDFEYEIYEAVAGGHAFDRIDTKRAKEIRLKVYGFLNGYLKPAKAFKNVRQLQKAGYRY